MIVVLLILPNIILIDWVFATQKNGTAGNGSDTAVIAFYSKIEKAGSEKIGYAVNECHGVLEYWSVGILGLMG
jgi:hypothetical protein